MSRGGCPPSELGGRERVRGNGTPVGQPARFGGAGSRSAAVVGGALRPAARLRGYLLPDLLMRMNFEDFDKEMGRASILELLTTATCCTKELVRRGLPLKLTFEILRAELTRVVTTLELFGKE